MTERPVAFFINWRARITKYVEIVARATVSSALRSSHFRSNLVYEPGFVIVSYNPAFMFKFFSVTISRSRMVKTEHFRLLLQAYNIFSKKVR